MRPNVIIKCELCGIELNDLPHDYTYIGGHGHVPVCQDENACRSRRDSAAQVLREKYDTQEAIRAGMKAVTG